MKNKYLTVSECFYSIQGEGQTMGIPAVFLRLAKCNLLCKSDTWVCDTIEVWQTGVKTQFEDVLSDDYTTRLREGAHLVITGGEPLLHQRSIERYLDWFVERWKFLPIIEIETNGTILPSNNLDSIVDYWNCSPKLSNSGEPYEKRFNIPALIRINNNSNSIFKFVVASKEDVLEIINEFGPYIDMKKVMLMPAGDSIEALHKNRLTVVEQCIKLGFRYCDRLQVVTWNKTTGV